MSRYIAASLILAIVFVASSLVVKEISPTNFLCQKPSKGQGALGELPPVTAMTQSKHGFPLRYLTVEPISGVLQEEFAQEPFVIECNSMVTKKRINIINLLLNILFWSVVSVALILIGKVMYERVKKV